MSGCPVFTLPMTEERAREIAAGFDLRALPPDFYANPYPVYSLLLETEPRGNQPPYAEDAKGWQKTQRDIQ